MKSSINLVREIEIEKVTQWIKKEKKWHEDFMTHTKRTNNTNIICFNLLNKAIPNTFELHTTIEKSMISTIFWKSTLVPNSIKKEAFDSLGLKMVTSYRDKYQDITIYIKKSKGKKAGICVNPCYKSMEVVDDYYAEPVELVPDWIKKLREYFAK